MFQGKPIVQKYGGTSVGNVERIKKIAQRVVSSAAEGKKIAVVVSAMSGETNRLVGLIQEINPEGSSRHYDMAVAAGEQVSVALMASAIEAAGGKAHGWLAYQLGIFTNESHSRARIESIDVAKLDACWQEGKIPVIAGFQGVTKDLEITTLGRGGSDTSAVALAVALKSEYCEINTDVDGVYTADPRVVKGAKMAEHLDFEVALEMASLGSKVLHSRCVELGAKNKMPIFVRSTFNEDESIGTKIMSYSAKERLEAPVVSGVTLDRDVVKISLEGLTQSGAISDIFKLVAELSVDVDVIIHNHIQGKDSASLGFTIGTGDKKKVMEALNALKQRPGFEKMSVSAREDLAKVSVVGLGMISQPGVASRVFETLRENDIEILMISTSEIKISCVIEAKAADKATQSLHSTFVEES